MTATLVSLALILTPSPIVAPKEAPTPWATSAPIASTVGPIPTTSISFVDHPQSPAGHLPESLFAEIESAVTPALPNIESAEEKPSDTTTATSGPIPTPTELVDELFGWPGRQLVQCESTWNQYAVGRYGERGLFQIHPVHTRAGEAIPRLGYSWADMFEIEPNIRVAVEIRRVQGLRAWTCWRG